MDDLIALFFKMKWPDGFRCPRCGHPFAYPVQGRRLPLYQCRACKHQTSLIAGTALQGSRTPLEKWAAAMQAMSRSPSINAVQLMHAIDVTYKTAWSMLKKLRESIHRTDESQPLLGKVEAGSTTYGTPAFRTFIRYPNERPVIVGISYDNRGGSDYIKIKPGPSELLLSFPKRCHWENEFVRNHVRSIHPVNVLQRVPFHKHNDLRNTFYSARAWINRTFRGISSRYLELYFDEYCFRINMQLRNQNPFEMLICACMQRRAPVYSTAFAAA